MHRRKTADSRRWTRYAQLAAAAHPPRATRTTGTTRATSTSTSTSSSSSSYTSTAIRTMACCTAPARSSVERTISGVLALAVGALLGTIAVAVLARCGSLDESNTTVRHAVVLLGGTLCLDFGL
jgi:hypothetical protein